MRNNGIDLCSWQETKKKGKVKHNTQVDKLHHDAQESITQRKSIFRGMSTIPSSIEAIYHKRRVRQRENSAGDNKSE